MSNTYDAVVIGGGHNGLVAACYLAKAGRRVLVLERYHTVGGAAITEEIHPGFRVSVASYSMSFPDGRHLLLYVGARARSKAMIATFSQHDADAYDAWEDFWDRCCD